MIGSNFELAYLGMMLLTFGASFKS
jgi:hypothetical protein